MPRENVKPMFHRGAWAAIVRDSGRASRPTPHPHAAEVLRSAYHIPYTTVLHNVNDHQLDTPCGSCIYIPYVRELPITVREDWEKDIPDFFDEDVELQECELSRGHLILHIAISSHTGEVLRWNDDHSILRREPPTHASEWGVSEVPATHLGGSEGVGAEGQPPPPTGSSTAERVGEGVHVQGQPAPTSRRGEEAPREAPPQRASHRGEVSPVLADVGGWTSTSWESPRQQLRLDRHRLVFVCDCGEEVEVARCLLH